MKMGGFYFYWKNNRKRRLGSSMFWIERFCKEWARPSLLCFSVDVQYPDFQFIRLFPQLPYPFLHLSPLMFSTHSCSWSPSTPRTAQSLLLNNLSLPNHLLFALNPLIFSLQKIMPNLFSIFCLFGPHKLPSFALFHKSMIYSDSCYSYPLLILSMIGLCSFLSWF